MVSLLFWSSLLLGFLRNAPFLFYWMKLSKKKPVSLFLKKAICFLGFLIKRSMFNQRGGNSCGCSSFFFEATCFLVFWETSRFFISWMEHSTLWNSWKNFICLFKRGKPFRWFSSFAITFPPTRENLVAGFPLTLSSRARGCAPYKPHTIETMPFLVLCTGCRTDTAGRSCAAPSRGVLCKWDTLYTFLPSTFSYSI